MRILVKEDSFPPPMTPTLHTYPDSSTALAAAADAIGALAQGVRTFRIAASGGSAADIFPELLQRGQDVSNWEVFMADERFIPPHDADSNRSLLYKKFIHHAGCSFLPIPVVPEVRSPEESATLYEQQLRTITSPHLFDVVILGMGEDGHTASLFPGGAELSEESKLVTTSQTDHFAVRERMTLTFTALSRSKHIVLLSGGEKKEKTLAAAMDEATDFLTCPAHRALRCAASDVFFWEKV